MVIEVGGADRLFDDGVAGVPRVLVPRELKPLAAELKAVGR